MQPFYKHLINSHEKVLSALAKLDQLAADAILFVIDEEGRLNGSLTDGDVRRGLLRGKSLENEVSAFIQPNPKFIRKGKYDLQQVISFRNGNFKVIPILNEADRIVNVINFRIFKSYLPIDAVIMAGGRGERLRPLTDATPKPLLKVGEKPIIQHNLDRLMSYGIDDFWISIRYMGEQIQDYFQDGSQMNVSINYISENEPLGTIGAVGQIGGLSHDTILVSNSDILTNLDYEDFYQSFMESGADMSVVTIPYDVSIPYAVLETTNGHVVSFKEKPTYTYYSNGGIYLMKKEILKLIPRHTHYNATDLMEKLIHSGHKVHSYPLRGYWLDIGKMEDYQKAQLDIRHIKF